MPITSASNDFYAVARREAALAWGWALFTSGVMGGAIVSCFLYQWALAVGGGTIALWADGFICVPFGLLSYIGFIQIVSGTTCNRLHRVWSALKFWRQILIFLFVTGVVYFLLSFTYFIMTLTGTHEINGDI